MGSEMLDQTVREVHAAGKKIFLHIDLVEGVGKDKAGLIYVKNAGMTVSTSKQELWGRKEKV